LRFKGSYETMEWLMKRKRIARMARGGGR